MGKQIFQDKKFSRKEQLAIIENDISATRMISEVVAFSIGVKDDIIRPTRGNPQIALARQMAMYLSHIGFGISINRVAAAFGRDRTTVSYACNLIEDKRDDRKFDEYLDKIEQLLSDIPHINNQCKPN